MSSNTPYSMPQCIAELDLSDVVQRLQHVSHWRRCDAEAAAEQYRNYLLLIKKYPHEHLPPSLDIDEVWHTHILHTQAYRRFCREAFPEKEGGYLNHDPTAFKGASKAEIAQAFARTQQLYKQEFGSYLYALTARSLLTRWVFDPLRQFLLSRFPKLAAIVEE